MTAEDVKALLPRIKSALAHGDHENAIWFIVFRDRMFNELPTVERLRYIAWARTQLPDPWCVPNLWGSEAHISAVKAAACAGVDSDKVN